MVADASALVEFIFRTDGSGWIAGHVTDRMHDLHVPALCDIEVSSAIRRALLIGALDEGRAEEAVSDYLDLPLTRHGHTSLVGRILELRENLSAYDAASVALAERLGGHLLTADAALRRSVAADLDVPLLTG